MDITLVVIRSQRDRVDLYETYARTWFERFKAAAARNNMLFEVATPDDLVLQLSASGRAHAYLKGRHVAPRDVIFTSKIMTWPAYMPDAHRMAYLISALQASGYVATVPTAVSRVNNDKMLTLVQPGLRDMPRLPSLRVMTRQFESLSAEQQSAITFPAAVKPATWGGGFGVLRVADHNELAQALRLAGAAELPMIVQPWIDDVIDYRIYCIDGDLYTALTRKARKTELVGNQMQRGLTARVDIPKLLVEPAKAVAHAIGSPYLCVDFLVAGTSFWLSEIEIDGGFLLDPDFDDVMDARFAAYRRLHERETATTSSGDSIARLELGDSGQDLRLSPSGNEEGNG